MCRSVPSSGVLYVHKAQYESTSGSNVLRVHSTVAIIGRNDGNERGKFIIGAPKDAGNLIIVTQHMTAYIETVDVPR